MADVLLCCFAPLRRHLGSKSPSTKVFGATLGSDLPAPVISMLSKLLVDGPAHDGVFRMCPSKKSVDTARLEIDTGRRQDVADLTVNTVAGLLKEWLRNVPGRLLPKKMLKIAKFTDGDKVDAALGKHISKLPAERQNALAGLIAVLSVIADAAASNRMTASNLAVCLAPNLLADSSLKAAERAVALITVIIEHAAELFNIAAAITMLTASTPKPADVKSSSDAASVLTAEEILAAEAFLAVGDVADAVAQVDDGVVVDTELPSTASLASAAVDARPTMIGSPAAVEATPTLAAHCSRAPADTCATKPVHRLLAAVQLQSRPTMRAHQMYAAPPSVDSPFTRSRVPLRHSGLAAMHTTVVSLVRLFETQSHEPSSERPLRLEIPISWSVRERVAQWGNTTRAD